MLLIGPLMPAKNMRNSLPPLMSLVWGALVIAGCLLFFFSPGLGQTKNMPLQDEIPQWIKPTGFIYNSQGKPDPFKPFISPESEAPAPEASEQNAQRILTPLERVQPSQLKLVGILWEQGLQEKALALVELPDGKGYILRPGARIGSRQGKVLSITPGQVVIQEQVSTVTGQKETQNLVLKLRQTAGGSDD